jgi:tagatose-1,6-bisphosphate aldolase non-catalytic subunit AgaZ/GatZ
MLIAADYGKALFDAAAGCADEPAEYRERMVAETQACLRRLADLSLREARALQLEVEQGCDGMWGAAGDRPADGDGHVRRWRVKR